MKRAKQSFGLNPEEIYQSAKHHQAMLQTVDGQMLFASPQPAATDFDPVVAELQDAIREVGLLESRLQGMRGRRATLAEAVERLLASRASYVSQVADGNPVVIIKGGFEPTADYTSISSLPRPENLRAEAGTKQGEVALRVRTVPRARSYIWEMREQPEDQPMGHWRQLALTTRASLLATGLPTSVLLRFRVAVLGSKSLTSPWSDEAVTRAGW